MGRSSFGLDLLPIATGDWQVDAVCLTLGDPDVMFPLRPADEPYLARRWCTTCPVQDKCLEVGWASEYGVFGGMTAAERRLVRTRPSVAVRRCVSCRRYFAERSNSRRFCSLCQADRSAEARSSDLMDVLDTPAPP